MMWKFGGKTVSVFLLLIFVLNYHTLFAQSKKTTSQKIIHKLGTSAQLQKEGYHYTFSQDSCVFYKTIKYRERDGRLMSSRRTVIPINGVSIQPENKKYDSLFTCQSDKKCVIRHWQDEEGNVLEEEQLDSASLYIENRKLAKEVYDLFAYLGTLCDRTQYSGPAGLQWGDSIEKSTQRLKQRFTLTQKGVTKNGAIFQQRFGDSFAGFDTNSIVVNYVDGKFYDMTIWLKISPGGSVAEKWHDVVKTIIDKYGNPNTINLPRAISGLDEFTNKQYFKNFDVFDLEISEGNWSPLAAWLYDNKVNMSVRVIPKTDAWDVQWQFRHTELAELAKARIKENPVEDF